MQRHRVAVQPRVMHNDAMLNALVLTSLLFAVPVDDVVSNVMNAYGGEAAWKKVTSVRETGRVEAMNKMGKMTREWKSPDSLRVEIVYPDKSEVRDVQGAHGTRNGAEATGVGLDAMRLQALRLALPYALVRSKSSLRDLGMRDALRVLELPLDATNSLTIFVDPATWHIVKSESHAGSVTFTTDYADFRRSGALLFAFKERNSAMGTPTGDNVIESIEIK